MGELPPCDQRAHQNLAWLVGWLCAEGSLAPAPHLATVSWESVRRRRPSIFRTRTSLCRCVSSSSYNGGSSALPRRCATGCRRPCGHPCDGEQRLGQPYQWFGAQGRGERVFEIGSRLPGCEHKKRGF